MRKVTAFIILDAFRWDYLDEKETPFLSGLARLGIYARKMRSSKGFTQRSCIMTGTWPATNGNFAMYKHAPSASRYRFLRVIPSPFLHAIEHVPLANKAVRFTLNQVNKWFFMGRTFPPSYIPFDILPLIGVSEDEIPIYEKGSFAPIEGLFDVLQREGKRSRFLMFPLSDGRDETVVKDLLALDDVDVFFAQFSDSDAGIHVAGVGSKGARRIIKDIDKRLSRIDAHLNEVFDEVEWIIIGDHGMMNVHKSLDVNRFVIRRLKGEGLRFGKDYFTFLSSTLTHFWWRSARAKRAIERLVQEPFFTDNGFLIDEEACAHFKIPSLGKEYGNIIWAANKGVLIFPDYFHRYHRYRAMHGYITDDDDMMGFAIVHNSKRRFRKRLRSCNLVDICPTIAESVGVPVPKDAVGRSLFRR